MQWLSRLFSLLFPPELPLPKSPADRAVQAAQARFAASYPKDKGTGNWRLVANESDRFVVRVRYGPNIPGSLSFFAVSKLDFSVSEMTDTAAYRPKVWR